MAHVLKVRTLTMSSAVQEKIIRTLTEAKNNTENLLLRQLYSNALDEYLALVKSGASKVSVKA